MKKWWQTIAKDYFTFSKKERLGIIALLILTGCFILFSRYYPVNKPKQISKDAFQQELAQLSITIDSNTKEYPRYKNNDREDYFQPKYSSNTSEKKPELFAFDPNTLDEAGWKKLGVREKTIATIKKLTSKGFRFKQPDDIKKVYGISPEDAEKLLPFVKIEPTIAFSNNANPSTTPSANFSKPPAAYKQSIVEINNADTAQFIALPGIGSKLANRIVVFRDKLGGFISVDQLGETFGLPDSTFQKIKPRLQMSAEAINKININNADINVLKNHPYIRWQIANAIINYKMQHGNFTRLDQLKNIHIITDEIFNKMVPYLEL